jgi:hypothetical protein
MVKQAHDGLDRKDGPSVDAVHEACVGLLRLTAFWNESLTVIRSSHPRRSWHSWMLGTGVLARANDARRGVGPVEVPLRDCGVRLQMVFTQ